MKCIQPFSRTKIRRDGNNWFLQRAATWDISILAYYRQSLISDGRSPEGCVSYFSGSQTQGAAAGFWDVSIWAYCRQFPSLYAVPSSFTIKKPKAFDFMLLGFTGDFIQKGPEVFSCYTCHIILVNSFYIINNFLQFFVVGVFLIFQLHNLIFHTHQSLASREFSSHTS